MREAEARGVGQERHAELMVECVGGRGHNPHVQLDQQPARLLALVRAPRAHEHAERVHRGVEAARIVEHHVLHGNAACTVGGSQRVAATGDCMEDDVRHRCRSVEEFVNRIGAKALESSAIRRLGQRDQLALRREVWRGDTVETQAELDEV